VPGTDSAAQLGMTTGQAMTRLDSVKRAMEDMVAELMSMALFYVDTILKGRVSALGAEAGVPKYTVGPENIRGHYVVSVTFQPNEQEVMMRKLAIASDAIVKGGLSPYDALEMAGFDNPQELIARRLAYDAMQEPLVKRAIARDMLKEWGIDATALEMEEQKEMGLEQVLLSQFMNQIQSGAMRGIGDPLSPNGVPPPANGGPNGQDPMAALAQNGQGAMPLPPGAQPQQPGLQPPQMVQQPVMQ